MRHILGKAVFSFPCCYGQHSFFCMPGTVVIGGTIPVCRIFASGVVKRSTFFAEQLFRTDIVTESTIQKILFLWLLYLTLFKNPTQNCDRRFFAQKIFFLRCYRRHIVVQRTARLLDSAQKGWNPPHSFVVIFDIAIPYF